MRVATALLLALASCATSQGPAEVSAAAADGGVRVRFRRLAGPDPDRPPELKAEGGTLAEITVSPDLKAISALWRAPVGRLSCRFPYFGSTAFEAGGPVDPGAIDYVFLDEDGVRVTAALPRGCLLLPTLPLHLDLPEEFAPARVVLPNGRSLPAAQEIVLPLTRDEHGVLRRGDMTVTIETARGPLQFVVSIDEDGTPAATSGYVSPETASPGDIGDDPRG